MSASTFIAWSGAMPTTSTLPTVATSATADEEKTLLQVRAGSAKIRVIEWGYGFEFAPANPVRVELLGTGLVGATITQHVAADLMPWADVGASSTVDISTTSDSGYNASAEGSITATRLLDYAFETGPVYKKQFPLGREPEVDSGDVLRVRATPTAAAASNMWAYLVWEE